jgi:hypothetical protein
LTRWRSAQQFCEDSCCYSTMPSVDWDCANAVNARVIVLTIGYALLSR